MSGLFTGVVLAATSFPPVRAAVTRTRAGSALAHRFVAGETLEDGLRVAREVNDRGMSVSLDYLGEEVADMSAAATALRAYLDCIEQIAGEGLDANISIKLTQLGLGIDRELASSALGELADAAGSAGTTVTVDMEDSRWTEGTVSLYEQVQQEKGNLGIALQAYLHRTAADLDRLAPLGGHIRLCKGAYAEPPEQAVQSRAECDANFAVLLARLMASAKSYPAIATHDARLVALTRALGRQREEPYEFQMLYGVGEPLQRKLVEGGHRLRLYVPYGGQWYPYLSRRLAERPANFGFFVRALLGA